MGKCIESELLGEICTLKINDNYSIAEITELFQQTFVVKILTSLCGIVNVGKEIEVRIETIDDEVYFYKAVIVSIDKTSEITNLTLKPISQLHEKNKRHEKRLKIGINIEKQDILYQIFPPIEPNLLSAELIDISPGGLQIKDINFQSVGQLIEINFGEPFFKKNEIVIARIIHTQKEEKHYIYSVQFLNLSDSNKKEITKYIDNSNNKITKTVGN